MTMDTVPQPFIEASSSEESEWEHTSWVAKFCAQRGNEYFCQIDEDYITDRFNLVGLGLDHPPLRAAYDYVTEALGRAAYLG